MFAELDYMILARYGPDEVLALLDEIGRGGNRLEPFSASDVAEARAVIEQHAGSGDVGMVNASTTVLARRHGTLTLDERRFRALRGPRGLPFRVLPADS